MGNALSQHDDSPLSPNTSHSPPPRSLDALPSPDPPPSLRFLRTLADPSPSSPNSNVVSRYPLVSRHFAASASAAARTPWIPSVVTADACGQPSDSSRTVSPVEMPDSTYQSTREQVPVCTEPKFAQSSSHVGNATLVNESANMIPTLIEWKHGGTNVYVEGSWDNWNSRLALQKSGEDFTLVKFLSEGVYHYTFVIDGERKHAPGLPYVDDTRGNAMNVLDVQNFTPENLDGLADFQAPASPDSSYDNSFPGPEDYTKDPPILPAQIHFNPELECSHTPPYSDVCTSMRPDHVILNHLFVESKKGARSPILTLGFTHRFRSKYVTVILHKPLRA